MSTAVVEVSGISKGFGGRSIIRDLSFTVQRGEILALVGSNGCGKTTLLKVLMGLLRPCTGSLLVFGRSHTENHMWLRNQIGFVPDRHCFYDWMTVGETLAFTSELYHGWNKSRCAELLDHFGLERHWLVRHLSCGQVSRLSLLLALSHNARLLLMDEPTLGLDPAIRQDLLVLLREFAELENGTVVFSSHVTSDIVMIADRIAIMSDGRFKVHASMQEVQQRYATYGAIDVSDSARGTVDSMASFVSPLNSTCNSGFGRDGSIHRKSDSVVAAPSLDEIIRHVISE